MPSRCCTSRTEPACAPVDETRVEVGHRLVDRHGQTGEPGEFELLGLDWALLPQVFAPTHTDSTELFTRWLPFPVGGRFLEVGCGAGVTAVTAALAGCTHVTAVDITHEAVCNTALNAERHKVADRVETVRSDLYDALDPGARFDAIFWNSNVVRAPQEFVYTRPLQHAIFDRGYAAHRRYLREGLERLTGSGRLFLGFNSLGDTSALQTLAAESGVLLVGRERSVHHAGDVPVEFQLLEAVPAGDRQMP
ncbi:class I SAM-dependent methyltransferase [Streptomyces sp. NBC_01283]|uniref:methyltransferase n=1 Tax=Streptomyces sp. NBC_01283 TaxID=2903812 RepID=UPI00352BFD01|nr:class I SAM-dependent methyltransferase [Streptomyces sp. NBC_01283]